MFRLGTEEYYQKFIELQEKLRRSEEERLKLEMKFNEMMQVSREEEQSYYKRLRSQYKRFLEENRSRQERNERILRLLERVEGRAAMIEAKTERFQMLRNQYRSYLDRIVSKKAITPKETKNLYNESKSGDVIERYMHELNPRDTQTDIAEEILKSIHERNSGKLDNNSYDDYGRKVRFDHTSGDSSLEDDAQSVSEKAGNYKIKGDYKIDSQNKNESQCSNKKAPSDFRNNQTGEINHANNSSGDKFRNLHGFSDDYGKLHDRNDVHTNNSCTNSWVQQNDQRSYDNHYQQQNFVQKHPMLYDKKDANENQAIKTDNTAENKAIKILDPDLIVNTDNIQNQQVEFNKHLAGGQDNPIQMQLATHNTNYHPEGSHINNYDMHTDQSRPTYTKSEQLQCDLNGKPLQNVLLENNDGKLQYDKNSQPLKYQQGENNEENGNRTGENVMRPIDGVNGQALQDQRCNKSDPNGEMAENVNGGADGGAAGPQYHPRTMAGEKDMHNSPSNQYDETNRHNIQYDKNEQLINSQDIPYDKNGREINDDADKHIKYDKYRKPINNNTSENIKLDENGQPLNTRNVQYDKNGQSHNESPYGHPVNQNVQYDEHNGMEKMIKYDENGQQMNCNNSENNQNNGQPINTRNLHYDKNGLVKVQYDENGQVINDCDLKQLENDVQNIEYDEHGQVINNCALKQLENDEDDQSLCAQNIKYDENGRVINGSAEKQLEYDEKGQPLNASNMQYNENGQVINNSINKQGENNSPINYNIAQNAESDKSNNDNNVQYDNNGQLVNIQYDENGQIINAINNDQNSENNKPTITSSDTNIQNIHYDENGEPINYNQNQNVDENGEINQYDENGQHITYQQNEDGTTNYPQSQNVHYDENGQLVNYDENGQPVNYDENGQPISQVIQYDENGQPVNYDENGQPISQVIEYDENGQPIYPAAPEGTIQYDQPIQYDANGEPIGYDTQEYQYDEHGQIVQYDENGQPIQYGNYDENGQPLNYGDSTVQYDEQGYPVQLDENGQPVQYDENGQIVQYDLQSGEGYQQNDENSLIQPQTEDTSKYGTEQDSSEITFGENVAQNDEKKANVLDLLETDTESAKQDTNKGSNDSDFDFSNA